MIHFLTKALWRWKEPKDIAFKPKRTVDDGSNIVRLANDAPTPIQDGLDLMGGNARIFIRKKQIDAGDIVLSAPKGLDFTRPCEFTFHGVPERRVVEADGDRLFFLFGSPEQAKQAQEQLRQSILLAENSVYEGKKTGSYNAGVGCLAGAATGAAAGSIGGPPGACAGAVVGTLIGLTIGVGSGVRQVIVLDTRKEIDSFISEMIDIYRGRYDVQRDGQRVGITYSMDRLRNMQRSNIYRDADSDAFVRQIYNELMRVFEKEIEDNAIVCDNLAAYTRQESIRHLPMLETSAVLRRRMLDMAEARLRINLSQHNEAPGNEVPQIEEA